MKIKSAKYVASTLADYDKEFIIHVILEEETAGRLYVPKDEQNTDYQAILAWVAEGNTIEPADEEISETIGNK